MKRNISVLFFMVLAFSLISQSAQEIVEKADSAFEGERVYSISSMTVFKNDEAQPVQRIESYSMEKNDTAYSLSVYVEPRRMKGTANLMIGDDLWVRFSSTGRIRKLSSSAKKNSAGGSDFSYADMGDGGAGLAEKYNTRLIGDESVKGTSCFVIELIPESDQAPYEKMVVYISKEDFHYLQIDYYEKGAKIKHMEFDDYRTVSGKDYPFRYTMFNHAKPSRTEVVIHEFEVDSPRVQDRLFTTRYLETIR